MKPKAPEIAKPKAATPAVKPVVNAPAVPSNPLQPAAGAPGKPHTMAPGTPTQRLPGEVDVLGRHHVPPPIPAVQVKPETVAEVVDVPPPVVLFGRSENEIDEPHWVDPVTGFPDTQRRRDGSLFSTPKP